ncbi:hypothetical protein GH714_009585 [Hevea brasiliensis]|uniref:CBS domain-containing protein n=1 Tax=Hevea brasiliensis TaxID=3981 RepID=A0A6A6KDK6_HEVBR|nr:hypothetical protein GH714_009585 [Hevea brasiliensis]
MVDVICYLCKDENLMCPSTALKAPLSVLLPKIPGLVTHAEPSARLPFPCSSALGAISRCLTDHTSVAVVDGEEGILIGELSPFTLACCDETVAAAITTLSCGDLMAYIDCGGPPEDLVRIVMARLKQRGLEAMLKQFTNSTTSLFSLSSSSSSDEESGTPLNWSGRSTVGQ